MQMSPITYNHNIDEITEATLDFLESRKLLKLFIIFMQAACILVILTSIYKIIYHKAHAGDYIMLISASIWTTQRRKINRKLIKNNLKKHNVDEIKVKVESNINNISWSINNSGYQTIAWKKIAKAYQNSQGVIIPLTGLKYAAKFVWLPFRALADEHLEEIQKKLGNKITPIS